MSTTLFRVLSEIVYTPTVVGAVHIAATAVPAVAATPAGTVNATAVAESFIDLVIVLAAAEAEIVPPVADIAVEVEIAAYNESAPLVKTVAVWATAVAGVVSSLNLKL
jgi:hypothetical protein